MIVELCGLGISAEAQDGLKMRQTYLVVGCLMIIGTVVLPLLPTMPFLLIAAACFARSLPRLEAWLLSHRRFGPLPSAWRQRGAIPRSG